ncbi:MAG: AmmeMemoRadiSam system protein B [Candidatus Limnocylindrales bacterium]
MRTHGPRGTLARTIRPPAVAGMFYPAGAAALRALVEVLLAEGSRPVGAREGPGGGLPMGILVPHAGLVYSGATAAAAWRLLAGTTQTTVVILGTNHGAGWLQGVAAWDEGRWWTPLGEIGVDAALAAEIVGLGSPFCVDRRAHAGEHSIEVQLPILHAVARDATIVPLSVAAGTGVLALDAGRRLGELLVRHRAAGRSIVLAISSDMAHYPAAAACERATTALLPAIRALDAAALAHDERALRGAGIPGLSCGMCGIEPAVLGLAALAAMGATASATLAATTSADAGGPPDRTVGYLAVRFDP